VTSSISLVSGRSAHRLCKKLKRALGRILSIGRDQADNEKFQFPVSFVLTSNEITFISGNDLSMVMLGRGYFVLNNVPLDPGENTFSALLKMFPATPVRRQSISVIYNTSQTPDMESRPMTFISILSFRSRRQTAVNISV